MNNTRPVAVRPASLALVVLLVLGTACSRSAAIPDAALAGAADDHAVENEQKHQAPAAADAPVLEDAPWEAHGADSSMTEVHPTDFETGVIVPAALTEAQGPEEPEADSWHKEENVHAQLEPSIMEEGVLEQGTAEPFNETPLVQAIEPATCVAAEPPVEAGSEPQAATLATRTACTAIHVRWPAGESGIGLELQPHGHHLLFCSLLVMCVK